MANKGTTTKKEKELDEVLTKNETCSSCIIRKEPQLGKLLLGLYYTKIPVIVWGNPGVGKTHAVKWMANVLQLADWDRPRKDENESYGDARNRILKNKKMILKCINASQLTEPEITGVYGMPNGQFTIKVPDYIQALEVPGGIYFIDEYSRANTQAQNMLLSLVQDCVSNSFIISEDTFRVLCTNYDNDVGSKAISLASTNRCVNIHVSLDVKAWADGRRCNWMNIEEPKVTTDPEELLKKQIKYMNLSTDFVLAHNDCLYNMPEDVIDKKDVSFATPRTWDLCDKALAYLDENDDDYVKTIIYGIVGESAGMMYWKFLKSKKDIQNINLMDYVGKEESLRFSDPDKLNQVYDVVKQTMYLLSKVPDRYKDLAIMVMNLCHNKDNKYGDYLSKDNLVITYLKSIYIVLTNAVKEDDLEGHSNIAIELAKRIDDWNDLFSLSLLK